jgi:hypothetical protein
MVRDDLKTQTGDNPQKQRILSENIKKDVVIGGVTGTLEDGGSFKAVIERTAVSPTLPGDLTTIGYSAFSGCPNLALSMPV